MIGQLIDYVKYRRWEEKFRPVDCWPAAIMKGDTLKYGDLELRFVESRLFRDETELRAYVKNRFLTNE